MTKEEKEPEVVRLHKELIQILVSLAETNKKIKELDVLIKKNPDMEHETTKEIEEFDILVKKNEIIGYKLINQQKYNQAIIKETNLFFKKEHIKDKLMDLIQNKKIPSRDLYNSQAQQQYYNQQENS